LLTARGTAQVLCGVGIASRDRDSEKSVETRHLR